MILEYLNLSFFFGINIIWKHKWQYSTFKIVYIYRSKLILILMFKILQIQKQVNILYWVQDKILSQK